MKALVLLAGTALLGLASQADATIYLGLQATGVNGGAVTQIASDNGTGLLSYSGTYGTFISSISAQGFPVLPQPMLQTNTVNTQSSGGGTVTLYITQTGLTPFTGNLTSSFTANSILNFGAGAASVVESTLLDAGNGLFTGTQLASATFTSIGTQVANNAISGLTGPFSETTKYVVTFGTGGGSVNNTINFAGTPAVPEPASWAMMISGFGLVGGALRQRRRTAVRFA